MSDAAVLLAEYRSLRERAHNGEPGLKARARAAYNRWFKQACAEGTPPDSLQRSSRDETERFFSRVIPGVDGHSYWEGGARFARNDGTERNPRYWWWEHVHGPLERRAILKPVCGERNCITLEHLGLETWAGRRRRFTDEQCIGALQVAAGRLGRTPTKREYQALHLQPGNTSIEMRFGSWRRALEVAGLPPSPLVGNQYEKKWDGDDCLRALREMHARYGFVPSLRWWREQELLPSTSTIRRRFGTWKRALAAAGIKGGEAT